MRSGMTLMSVMVAVALSGIVALAVARLLGNQAKSMSVIRLREQRENLLKHYKNIVVSGWDSSRQSSGGVIRSRKGDSIIASGGLYLKDDLYEYEHLNPGRGTAGRWWKVSVNQLSPSSGKILQADSWVEADPLVAVEVKVEFKRDQHPVVDTRLASREEIVFLHHNTAGAQPTTNTTQCLSAHSTMLDSSGKNLYSGQGALIQYDFISDYAKCSQVPLVNSKSCDKGALIGFLRTKRTGTLKEQLITGNPICSTTDHTDPIAEIRGSKEKRTVEAINCKDQGYIEWMRNDEKPRCVTPFTGSQMRVAAESKANDEVEYKDYSIECKTGTASWTTKTFKLKRCGGIHAFNSSGPSGEVNSYKKWGAIGAGKGPPGPPGCGCGPAGDPGPDATKCSCCCPSCPAPSP